MNFCSRVLLGNQFRAICEDAFELPDRDSTAIMTLSIFYKE